MSELPDKYITHESLTTQYCLSHGKKSAERINAAYILIDRGSFKDIPKHLITEKLLLSPDREILTDFSGIEPSLSDGKFFYCSLISTAAMSGAIKEIPQELLTYDLMNYYDNSDTISNTPAIWYAAKNGNLKYCPKNSYNETSLMSVFDGTTAWHGAARFGEIREIPKEYYTEEAFQIKDKKGNFIADYLSEEDKIYVNNVLNERLHDVLVMSRTVVTTQVGEFVL